MKKRITKIVLAVVLAMALATSMVVFSGCGNNHSDTDFIIHQIIMDSRVLLNEQDVIVIKTYLDLQEFIAINEEKTLLVGYNENSAFANLRHNFFYTLDNNFSKDFFNLSYLVIINFLEPQGGINHDVLGIRNNGTINIRRTIHFGTDALVAHSIIIELPLSFNPIYNGYNLTINWTTRTIN